jgi:hypothetical protein|tara:strand:+ start:572 stop:838 length:267 start_codon:yes stop_codon:yes gene_type:complete
LDRIRQSQGHIGHNRKTRETPVLYTLNRQRISHTMIHILPVALDPSQLIPITWGSKTGTGNLKILKTLRFRLSQNRWGLHLAKIRPTS